MRLWIKLILPLGLTAGLVAVAWIFTALQVKAGERYFREAYPPGKDFYIVMSDYEWAGRFGGHAGLSRLKALSHDQSLQPGAGRVANEACSYIESGRYIREITMLEGMRSFRESPLFWFYLRCLHLRESLLSWLFTGD